jgi:hypothetical protein
MRKVRNEDTGTAETGMQHSWASPLNKKAVEGEVLVRWLTEKLRIEGFS